MKLQIAIHQINTITGDLDGNTDKIVNLINEDKSRGIDITIFPETAISAYCCGALWDRLDFVTEQQEKLQIISNNLSRNHTVIVGFVSVHGVNLSGFPKLKNSVAIINNDKIQIYHKQLLANSDHHEDKKYFEPGTESSVFKISTKYGKIKIGVPICEDAWFTDHKRNIPEEMVAKGAKLLVIPNQSYFYYSKQEIRSKLIQRIARNNNVPVIWVNSIGVGDIVKNLMIFDGGSLISNKKGRIIQNLKRFDEESIRINLDLDDTSMDNLLFKYNKFDEIISASKFVLTEYLRLCGIKNGQVHISGGLDSAIVAYLTKISLGKDNTILITNPSNLNSKSLKYIDALSKALDISYYTNPIQKIYDLGIKIDEESFGNPLPENGIARSTFQAVLRTTLGLTSAHRFKSAIIATGNHTEIVLGWATFHDIGSVGLLSLIGDLTKVELFQLAEYINNIENKEIIPENLFNGNFKPAAELPDAQEDPFDYYVYSGICADLIRNRKSKNDLLYEFNCSRLSEDLYPWQEKVYKYNESEFASMIDIAQNKMRISPFKTGQAPPIPIMAKRSRGFSNRETLINKYNK